MKKSAAALLAIGCFWMFGFVTPTKARILKILYFAVLLGLEKGWASQFKDIYARPPDWYDGNWQSFSTIYLASALSDFSSYNNQVFAAPSSSSASGSGGGGFSGGGGGGGGGW